MTKKIKNLISSYHLSVSLITYHLTQNPFSQGEGGRLGLDCEEDQCAPQRVKLDTDDVYIVSWIEGLIAQQVIENAIDNGDITRAGIVASANEVTVDLQGLALFFEQQITSRVELKVAACEIGGNVFRSLP